MILVTRQQWGSRITVIPQSRDAKPEAYVHHVAGRWPTSPADEEAHMRELQAYAINKKQYVDLDYSWLIGPSGRCYEGRGMFGMAAATKDRNAVSRAVCLMGNLDTREPSPQQLDVLPHLLAEMVRVGSLMARVRVFGHYENPAHPGATACPGRFMKPYLPAVRARLDSLLHPSPPTTAPPMSEEDDMPLVFYVTDREKTGREMVTIYSGSGDPQVVTFPGAPDDRDAFLAAVRTERGKEATPVVVHSTTFDAWAADSLAEDE